MELEELSVVEKAAMLSGGSDGIREATPAKLRLWKNSCLRRPKNPSAAALSGEQPFALIERVRLLSMQMRIHSGHR